MENNIISKRVEIVRQKMRELGAAALVVPTSDPHDSEYIAERWKCREWLTGFTGSAGLAVLTLTDGALWTDSRYFLQAEHELSGTPFQLMRDGEAETPTPCEWLSRLPEGSKVCYVEEMMPESLHKAIFATEGLIDFGLSEDCFDEVWTERPAMPAAPIEAQPLKLSGESAIEKIERIHSSMQNKMGAYDYLFLSDLSEIAWTLNLRGADIAYNPVFYAYLLLSRTGRSTLFVAADSLSTKARKNLKEANIDVAPYDKWRDFLAEIAEANVVFFSGVNCKVMRAAKETLTHYTVVDSPVAMMRALKNQAERKGFRAAMERDGVALVRFLRWLETAVPKGGETEWTIGEKLAEFRAEGEKFRGLSFATIAGYGPNGAIVHYEAEKETASPIQPKGLLLLDSGAQYQDGTTDITRTIALGPLTQEERRVYTLVLKGHIALSDMYFPEGITGLQLDTAARLAMWKEGYDFGHGTGHGVGSFLNVHEGPMQIRKNKRADTLIGFQEGMTITDEPGLYIAGSFGVRIENVLLAVKARKNAFGKFLKFEPLTLCPIDTRPIDFTMLNKSEINWLNAYHEEVRNRLLPLLDKGEDRRWLIEHTKKLVK